MKGGGARMRAQEEAPREGKGKEESGGWEKKCSEQKKGRRKNIIMVS